MPDVVSFNSLYREYAPRVRGLVRLYVRDRELAEDVIQETFLRVFRAMERLDPNRDPWPWIATIAKRLCRDLSRRSSMTRERAVVPEVLGVEQDARSVVQSPEDDCISTESRQVIRDALARVSPRYRRLLVRREIEAERYGEIALTEGISNDALKSALKRARQAFRGAYAAVAAERGLDIPIGALFAVLGLRCRSVGIRIQEWLRRGLVAGPDALTHAAAAWSAATVVAVGAALGSWGVAEAPGVKEAARQAPLDVRPGVGSAFDVWKRRAGQIGRSDSTAVAADVSLSTTVVETDEPSFVDGSVRARRDRDRWEFEDRNGGSTDRDQFGGGGEMWIECESGSLIATTTCQLLDTVFRTD